MGDWNMGGPMSCPHCWPDAVPVEGESGTDSLRVFVCGGQGYLAVEPHFLFWGDGEPFDGSVAIEVDFCPFCGRDLSEVAE